jgi:hypothetical protein
MSFTPPLLKTKRGMLPSPNRRHSLRFKTTNRAYDELPARPLVNEHRQREKRGRFGSPLGLYTYIIRRQIHMHGSCS